MSEHFDYDINSPANQLTEFFRQLTEKNHIGFFEMIGFSLYM